MPGSSRAERRERARAESDRNRATDAEQIATLPKAVPEFEVRTCATCGATFTTDRPNRKYCDLHKVGAGGRRPSAPSSTARGYGGEHQRKRREWERRLDDGEYVECHAIVCFMPSRVIDPAEPWDLGHTLDRSDWTGPEHRRCNRKEPQLRGAGATRRT